MEAILQYLNGNKFFWGVTMLLLNFGSKYIIGDLGKIHEQFLANEFVKKLITFSLFFVATRDIIIAFVLTILYVLIVDGVLHEKRNFSLVRVTEPGNTVNTEEYKKAKEVIKAYEEVHKNETGKNIYELYKDSVLSI